MTDVRPSEARYALVAEPDAARGALYRVLLDAEGLEPLVTRDGAEARAALERRGTPALLLTELSLSGVDGFALLRELRRRASPRDTPAVVVSAFRELRETATRLRDELGIAAVLSSSAGTEAIQRAVKDALAGSPEGLPAGGFLAGDTAKELRRLAAIESMGIVDDRPPDEELQAIVQETATAFRVPVALISLVLRERQWFKAHVGLSGALLADRGTPIEWSFCRHAVDGEAPLVVPDATSNPFFAKNPLVTGGIVGSYAGAPLVTPEGQVIGTLCIIDSKPLTISQTQIDTLVLFARRVAGELVLRHGARRAAREARRLGKELEAERVRQRDLLRHLAHFDAILDGLDTGVLLTDARRHVLYANDPLAALFSTRATQVARMTRDEFLQHNAWAFDDPADYLRRLRTPESGPFAAREEIRIARPVPRILRWIARPVELASEIGHLETFVDVTAEAELAAQQARLAVIDSLTELANRRGGERALAREVARAGRSGSPLSLALFDVDRFKEVNDAHGHAAGDEVLRAIGRTLSASVRASDLAIRWGGEELLVILPDTALAGARIFAERIRILIEGLGADGRPAVTVSAGVAALAEGEDFAATIARADAKLYEAKAAGRNCVRG